MLKFLNKPYPFNDDLKDNTRIIFFISLGVFVFLAGVYRYAVRFLAGCVFADRSDVMRAERLTTTDEIWAIVCSRAEENGMIPAELAGLLLTYAVGALMDGHERPSKKRPPASADNGNLSSQHDG